MKKTPHPSLAGFTFLETLVVVSLIGMVILTVRPLGKHFLDFEEAGSRLNALNKTHAGVILMAQEIMALRDFDKNTAIGESALGQNDGVSFQFTTYRSSDVFNTSDTATITYRYDSSTQDILRDWTDGTTSRTATIAWNVDPPTPTVPLFSNPVGTMVEINLSASYLGSSSQKKMKFNRRIQPHSSL